MNELPLPTPRPIESVPVVARGDAISVPLPTPRLQPKRNRDRPVAIVRADRDDLTCFTCDAPAPYRIVSEGVPGVSCCPKHKLMHLRNARRKLLPPQRARLADLGDVIEVEWTK